VGLNNLLWDDFIFVENVLQELIVIQ